MNSALKTVTKVLNKTTTQSEKRDLQAMRKPSGKLAVKLVLTSVSVASNVPYLGLEGRSGPHLHTCSLEIAK
jgi:hypothetical protein